MSIDKVLRKIHNDIDDQGYSAVAGPKWFYTVGFGKQGRKDLIVPAIMSFRVFQLLASKYATGEIPNIGKFKLDEAKIRTIAMGVEPGRFEFREVSSRDGLIFNEQLCSQTRIPEFVGFLAVQVPDDDNRLFGENESKFTASPEQYLRDIVFDLGVEIERKKSEEEAHRKHAEKVLAARVTPRNKRKKNVKKRR